ncbi:MAG TPA: YciI family protein [Candidatus Limnocylindria bacterium]|nr:YciI family protein [Candidatus Limnocylindria bacterium]
MRYVMFTYPDPELVATYEQLPAEEIKADVARHMAWFEKHRAHIDGGEELGYPQAARSLRRQGGRVVVSDGPFVETKEMLGGFIVLEVADAAEAERIASEWPSLEREGGGVTLQPVYVRGPETP